MRAVGGTVPGGASPPPQAAFGEDMNDYLRGSELTESRAFVQSFVKEVAVAPEGHDPLHHSHASRQPYRQPRLREPGSAQRGSTYGQVWYT